MNHENTEKEIWKDVVGFEGIYKISNIGNLKSIQRNMKRGRGTVLVKDRIIKQATSMYGYKTVVLCKNNVHYNKRVHRLVAQAFIPNPMNLPFVNHIDGIKTNNKISNLEWCTASENGLHAYRTGLSISKCNKPSISKPVRQIDRISGKEIMIFPSISEAARHYGFSNPSNIGECCRGIRKSAYGYKWFYL